LRNRHIRCQNLREHERALGCGTRIGRLPAHGQWGATAVSRVANLRSGAGMHKRVAPEQGGYTPATSSTSPDRTSSAVAAAATELLKRHAAGELGPPERGKAAKIWMPRRSRPVRGVSALERPRQGILARVLSACGGFSHSRRGSRANDYRTKLLAYSHYDSYKLNGEDSQIHWEAMTATSHRHVKILQFTTAGLVILIGSRRGEARFERSSRHRCRSPPARPPEAQMDGAALFTSQVCTSATRLCAKVATLSRRFQHAASPRSPLVWPGWRRWHTRRWLSRPWP